MYTETSTRMKNWKCRIQEKKSICYDCKADTLLLLRQYHRKSPHA